MSNFKRGLSAFLAFVMVLSVFSGVAGVFAPKASAVVEGTSMVTSYADLDAAYDQFIYLGLEAYEDDGSGNLVLSDYYVQPGDWVTYRLYMKSDRYIGNCLPYVTYDTTFFDIKIITDTPVLSGGYELNNKTGIVNQAHPMAYKGLTTQFTTKAASTVPQIKNGWCDIEYAVDDIGVVIAGWASDTATYKYPHLMQSDEWLVQWKVQVLAGLADGDTGFSEVSRGLYRWAEGVGNSQRPADIASGTRTDPSQDETLMIGTTCLGMVSQKAEIQAFLTDTTRMDFTIGEAPAGGTQYTATFKADGAQFGEVASYATGAEIAAPAEAPTKAGYVFKGWALEGTDAVLTFPQTMGNSNVVYVAIFEEVAKYTVTFYVDGVQYDEIKSYAEGETIEFPASPSKTGYTFTGWDNATTVMGTTALVYNAQFTPKQYDVEYYLESTDATPYETLKVNFGGTYNTPAAPSKAGYSFGGWYDADGVALGGTHNIDGVKKFYAKWDIGTFTSTFDANGGAWADGDTTKTFTDTYGAAYEIPADPTRTGYEFKGWNPEATGTIGTANVTYVAQWEAKQIGVYFYDGEESLGEKTGAYGTQVQKIDDPTKTGYTFSHWEDENGNTITFPYTLGAEPLKVYAQWTGNPFNIEFYNGDEFVFGGDQICGEPISEPKAPSKTGYEFAGWVDADGNPMPETVPASAATYYTSYTAIKYTITFLNADGSVFDTDKVTYRGTITAPAAGDPVKEGHNFKYWVKQGTTAQVKFPVLHAVAADVTYTPVFDINTYDVNYYVDNELKHTDKVVYGEPITPWTYPTAEGETVSAWSEIPATMPGHNVDVYATTGTASFTITYYVNDIQYGDPIPYAYGSAVSAPAYTVPEGYAFSGWDVPATMPAENLKLYATLTARTYNAIFYLDEEKTNVYDTVPTVYGENIVMPVDPEIPGKEFMGWDNDALVMGAGDMEFVAMFNDIEYFVEVLDENDESYGAEYEWIMLYNEEITEDMLPDATKEGYDFLGWLANGEKAEFPYAITEDTTFTPSYEIQGLKIYYVVGDETTYDSYLYGDAITLRDPLTKEGYTFSGWKDADGADAVLPATMPANDIYIYGSWTVNQYKVIFNAGEGQFADGSKTKEAWVDYNTVPVPEEIPTKAGYGFAGWDPALAPMGTTEVTYTAKYSAGMVGYTVKTYTMDVNGAYGEPVVENFTAATDAPVEAAAPAITGFTVDETKSVLSGTVLADGSLVLEVYYDRDQYDFSITTADGTTTKTYYYDAAIDAVAEPTKTGYSFAGWDKAVPATMPAENYAIVAQWNINQYTITFAETGDTTIAPITQDYDTAVTAPADPTKTGYTFAGWDIAVPEKMPAGDMTITAQWNINQYTITFANTGDTVIEPITQDYATAVTAPADPEKLGHSFAGWDVAVPATMPAGDMTITASWTVNTYIANFDINGTIVPVETKFGEVPVAPDASRVGYTHTGWDKEIVAIGVDGATYVAQYTANTYKATFLAEGGKFTTGLEKEEVDTVFDQAIVAPADPTREGYIFAGWTPEVGIMDAEGITFKAIWTQDLNFCRVQSVTQTNPGAGSYYKLGIALYEIKVMGSPIKLQIVSNADIGLTYTYDRADDHSGSANLSTVGLVDILAYNEAGEPVAFGSADTAYEVWQIAATLKQGSYKVRAKVDYSNESWESLDFAYGYEIAYDKAPVVTEMVKSIVADKDYVVRGEYMTFTVKTDASVSRLRFVRTNADGSTTTMSYSKDVASSYVTWTDNGDGSATWAIKIRFTYVGEDLEQNYTWNILYLVSGQSTWCESGKSIDVKVTRYEQSDVVVPDTPAYSIISISAPETAAKGKYTAVTIKTTADVTKVRFMNMSTKKTSTYLKTSNNVTHTDNGDGTATWVIEYRFTTAGAQEWGVQCRGNAWSSTEGNTFTLTVE